MASIVLGAAGTALGAASGLPFGAALGGALGRAAGGAIFGSDQKLRPLNGPRLADLGVQSSAYGKMIPIVYGTIRLGGNIIWSQNIKETATTTTSSVSAGGGKGGGGKISQSSTTYSYSVTLAIAICEGEVNEVLRIWADARQLDLSQYTLRIYKGSETQLPDSLIQAIEGVDRTPAFRGLAYVVLEDFPLADYGNRIPNFTFEVKKKYLSADYDNEALEEMITGMVMIPGAGEFVYDTLVETKIPGVQVGSSWIQQGSQQSINMHNVNGVANALLSIDQLAETCPNVEWISVVASWFATSDDPATCTVLPGVEYQTGAITSPTLWSVAGFDRTTAHPIMIVDDAPQYGGTPDDGSIVRYVDELRARGYKVMFYPIMFMDVAGKPWRGEMTGAPADVADFFTRANGYNAFITHYAGLMDGHVDGFVIGSELKGLTSVTDTPGNYPAVNALVSLAASVKTTLGAGVKVTYAADWSEYHHTDGGWYNLDPLWASPDIDMVGIDAYFPLTDAPQSGYDVDAVIDGWTSGEHYDFYYTDPGRTTTAALSPEYAIKNLDWFWNHTHTNPDISVTAWTPQMKKIWFTEVGFPSVDGATNQPNVFYDPSSVGSAFTYHSRGRIDFLAQRVGLTATHQQWKASGMVEQMFVWTWDARPFPYWPDLTGVWNDGGNWPTGHWVNGKLGVSRLAAIVADLCARAGLAADMLDVRLLNQLVDGFVLTAPVTYRDAIEVLEAAYFFDSVESGDALKFVPRGQEAVLEIAQDDMVATPKRDGEEFFSLTRLQEVELPKRVNIVYLTRLSNYQASTQHSQREVTQSREVVTLDLPIVCSDQLAKNIADVTLFSQWMARTGYQFMLPVKYAQLEPTDVITAVVGGVTHRMRIVSTRLMTPLMLQVQAVAEDVATFDFYAAAASSTTLLQENTGVATTLLNLLDIPAFPGDDADKGVLRAAAAGSTTSGWGGAALYRSDDGGSNYSRILDLPTASVMGTVSGTLASGPTTVFDETNTLDVVLLGDSELQSVTELAVLNGANAAVVGDEIVQFKTATLVSPGHYTLSGLLRGRLGTEWAVGAHAAGDRFVLLNGALGKQAMTSNVIGLTRQYKPVTIGTSLADATAQNFTYSGVALKPYSPVHITGARDGSGNLTLAWIRRARLGVDWQDGVDAPLNETTEAYEVDILDGSDVVRTITGLTSPSATYTAADQTTHFGSPQSSVSVRVYQLSGVVGRGYAGIAAV